MNREEIAGSIELRLRALRDEIASLQAARAALHNGDRSAAVGGASRTANGAGVGLGGVERPSTRKAGASAPVRTRRTAYANSPQSFRRSRSTPPPTPNSGGRNRRPDVRKERYEEVGRGFCLCSESADRHRGLPEGQTRTAYFAAEHISKVPFSQEDRRIVEQMVLTYEPRVQCVVVIEEDGEAFAYKVRGMRRS
jgi:hypothetical protein